MNVDGKLTVVSLEESLPQGCEGKRSPGQEEEGNLGDPVEGIRLDLGNHGSPPQQLMIGHTVHHGRRSYPFVDSIREPF